MATKKTTNASGKSNYEKKKDDIKQATTKTAKQVEKEFRAKTSWLGSWWSRTSDEEKIYMGLWIILLSIGLYLLLNLVLWMMFIVVGMLFITWFFVKKHK